MLSYDKNTRKHYIYYEQDSTAEWISLDVETVLYAVSFELVKTKQDGPTSWPGLRYKASTKVSAFNNEYLVCY